MQNMSAESCIRWPEHYMVGQRQELFNPVTIFVTLIYAIYTSIILFFLPFGVFQDSDLDYQTLAVTVEMSAVFSATVEVCLFSKLCKMLLLLSEEFECEFSALDLENIFNLF